MVGRASGSSVNQARQLLKLNAKNTKNVEQKIQILAVKAARIELSTIHGSRINSSVTESRIRNREQKMERLMTALQNYQGLTKREAAVVAKSLVNDYKNILQHGDVANPSSSVSTPNESRMTALNFALEKSSTAQEVAQNAFALVRDVPTLNLVLEAVDNSGWSQNPVVYDSMMEQALSMLKTDDGLHPQFESALQNFSAPLKERQAMTKYAEVLVGDLMNGRVTYGQMYDAIDGSPPEIRGLVAKELKKEAMIALGKRHAQTYNELMGLANSLE